MKRAAEWVRKSTGSYVCDGVGGISRSMGGWIFCAAYSVHRAAWARELEDAEPWPTLNDVIDAVRAQVGEVRR